MGDCMCGMASSVSPCVAIDRRRRARTHPRPSRRGPLSVDVRRSLLRLRRNLRQRGVSFPCSMRESSPTITFWPLKTHPPWHIPPLRLSSSIAVGERERTRALHGEILYPSTSSAASALSAGTSVRAQQASPAACVSLPQPSPFGL